MHISIRLATAKDATEISKLVIRNALPSLPEIAQAFMLQHNTPEKIKLRFSEAYLYFIALHEEQIVGVIGIKEYNDEPNHLYHLFVDKAYRRHGIARKMWDFYLEQCSEQAKNQSFRVNSSLMAVDVYKNFGFVENGEYFEKDHIPCVPMLLSKIE